MSNEFLPKKGSYKNLISYQKSLIIYDGTFLFCNKYLRKSDRTVDQMIQSARSCKQNIVEGAKAAITSSETEIKLTNVARASLEELLEDYHDYLRTRKLNLWQKESKESNYVRRLSSYKTKMPIQKIQNDQLSELDTELDYKFKFLYLNFMYFFESRSDEKIANIQICLIHQCNFLLDRQIKSLENDFLNQGGLKEAMFNARLKHRKKKSS